MRCLDGIIDSMDMNLAKNQEMVRDREAWHTVVHGVTVERDLATEQQQLRVINHPFIQILLELFIYHIFMFFNERFGKFSLKQSYAINS